MVYMFYMDNQKRFFNWFYITNPLAPKLQNSQ